MATKLTKEQTKRLSALNITEKTESAARAAIVKFLAKNDIDGMDDEDMDTLLDLAESLIPEGETNANASEDADAKALAQEAEAEEAEPEGDMPEGDEFDGMTRTELKKYIKDNGIAVKVFKSDSDDAVREKIRAAIAPAAEPEPEQEPEPTPAPKKATKKEEPKKVVSKRGTKLDPQNNEEDLKTLIDILSPLFPQDDFVYAPVKSAGVTIKHRGQNSNRALVGIENCSLQADGSIKCNLYFLTLTKQLEVLDNADITYEKCWSGAPFVKGTTLAEAVEMISAVKDSLTAQVKKIDKRLGENRAKMEEELSKKTAPAAKKTAPAAKKAAKTTKK